MKQAQHPIYSDAISCFLPVDSTLAAHAPMPVTDELLFALCQVAQVAAALKAEIDQQVLSMLLLAAGLVRLGQTVAEAQHLLASELPPGTTRQPGATPPAIAADLPDHAIVDRLFTVTRLPAMTVSQFAAQVADSSRRLLADLPFALLSINEIGAIINAIQLLFARLAQELGADHAVIRKQVLPQTAAEHNFLDDHRQLMQMWQLRTSSAEAWNKQVVFYRWFVGHHFFFLCTVYCRVHLLRAASAFAHADDERGAQQVEHATRLLRGTTAAMWYASNFPAAAYQQQIRPFLNEFGPVGGASGTQMLDYEALKQAKEQLKQALFTQYGNDPRQWSPIVRTSVHAFHEIYIEDMEQHTLLAAAKVGNDRSLAQKVWQAELPASLAFGNALELLREMTTLRRAEFKPFHKGV